MKLTAENQRLLSFFARGIYKLIADQTIRGTMTFDEQMDSINEAFLAANDTEDLVPIRLFSTPDIQRKYDSIPGIYLYQCNAGARSVYDCCKHLEVSGISLVGVYTEDVPRMVQVVRLCCDNDRVWVDSIVATPFARNIPQYDRINLAALSAHVSTTGPGNTDCVRLVYDPKPGEIVRSQLVVEDHRLKSNIVTDENPWPDDVFAVYDKHPRAVYAAVHYIKHIVRAAHNGSNIGAVDLNPSILDRYSIPEISAPEKILDELCMHPSREVHIAKQLSEHAATILGVSLAGDNSGDRLHATLSAPVFARHPLNKFHFTYNAAQDKIVTLSFEYQTEGGLLRYGRQED